MKKTDAQPCKQMNHRLIVPNSILGRMLNKLAVAVLLAGVATLLVVPARAQSVILLMTNANIFVGANFNGIYTNSQLRVAPSGVGATPVTLSVSGLPTGATIAFSTNGYVLAANPIGFTNTWTMFYSVAVTNVAKGIYPLTFTCSGAASASASVNLIVGRLWTNNAPAGDVTWSTPANWAGGAAPTAGDDVMFQDAGFNTNYVDVSTTIGSLSYLRNVSGTNFFTVIAPGATLSVTGTNGFLANVDSYTANSKTMVVNIAGSGGAGLVVSNKDANFIIDSDNTGTSGTTLVMTNLDNFSATVNRVGFGTSLLGNQGGGNGAQMVNVNLAKTNVIKALFGGNSFGGLLTNSIECFLNIDAFNNGGSFFQANLGISNSISADSFGVGLSKVGSGNNVLRFAPVFTNGITPYALFRNTNGGRMSMFMVAADSFGYVTNNGSNAKGNALLAGGTIDMLVDTIWIGRNRQWCTNAGGNITAVGAFAFTGGKVDVNTMRIGYQAYTNNQFVQGTVTVGGMPSTALLSVNTDLNLGSAGGDDAVTAPLLTVPQAQQGFGKLTINANGIVRANKITVGAVTTNNQINIAAGGLLDVTNKIASTNKWLTLYNSTGGALTLHLVGTNPVVYVTNLTTTGVNPINLASISGIGSFPVTIPVISYVSGSAASFSGGTAPGGVNVSVNNNTVNKTIDITLTTGTPKSLIWKGYTDNNWDVTTFNWLDVTTGLHTNFATGDNVVFDDSAAFSSINVAVDVVPRQSVVTGIAMTNDLLAYSFSGAGILGSASFTKIGTNTLEINNHTEVGMTLNQGTLIGSGDIGSVAVSSGAVMNFSGTVKSGVTCAGLLVNNGTIQTALTVQSGGVATNLSIVDGALTLDTGSYLYSSGSLNNIGSATVATNATLVNIGIINKGSLTISGTFSDNSGLDNFKLTGTLTINSKALFIPGGDGISATAVNHLGSGSFPGRVLLATGSTNVFKVDMGASPSFTVLYSSFQDFGPSQAAPAFNGCTLLITNIGAIPFAAGQSFKMFGNADNYLNINGTGTGTNSYPVITPAQPGAGLAWDLSSLRPSGVIRIVAVTTVPTNLVYIPTFTTLITTNSTNSVVINSLSWPTDYTGWRLQSQSATLADGLGTNWSDVFASHWTNSILITNAIDAAPAVFYRMVYP